MRLSRVSHPARCLLSIGLVAGLLSLAGCGRPVGTVTGTVKFKGVPLKGGSVTFISTDGQQTKSGAIGENGVYTVPNVTGGPYKVCVDTAFLRPPVAPGGMLPGAGGGPKAGVKAKPLDPGTNVPEGYVPSNPADANSAQNAKRFVQIPDKYADPKTTDLTFTVGGGDQTFDIDLKP